MTQANDTFQTIALGTNHTLDIELNENIGGIDYDQTFSFRAPSAMDIFKIGAEDAKLRPVGITRGHLDEVSRFLLDAFSTFKVLSTKPYDWDNAPTSLVMELYSRYLTKKESL